jgi:hypothetical protein
MELTAREQRDHRGVDEHQRPGQPGDTGNYEEAIAKAKALLALETLYIVSGFWVCASQALDRSVSGHLSGHPGSLAMSTDVYRRHRGLWLELRIDAATIRCFRVRSYC